METKLLWKTLVLLLCAINFASCSMEDNEEGAKVTNYQEYELTVASKKLLGVQSANGRDYITQVYAVKNTGVKDWEAFPSIQDFNYEEGYEYRIKVSETSYLDYSMGEPTWTVYKLLDVISKEKHDSEGLPDNLFPESCSPCDVQTRYVIQAENEQPVKDALLSSPDYLCKQYVFTFGWNSQYAMRYGDGNNSVWRYGTLEVRDKDVSELPDSYKLLPVEGQTTGMRGWTFIYNDGTHNEGVVCDCFSVLISGVSGTNTAHYQLWLYQDLTEKYKEKFPDAGVKTVVLVQIVG